MSLRGKFVVYLVTIHLTFAAALTFLLWDNRIWLIGVECFLVLSSLGAVKIFRSLFLPLDLIASGVEFIRDGDFTTRLRRLEQPEVDRLIDVYNQMIDHLRAERIKAQEQHFFLEKILSASPAAVVTLDYDGNISYLNPAAESLLRASGDELRGRSLREMGIPLALAMDELAVGNSSVLPLRGMRKVKCYRSTFLDQGHPRGFFILEELTDELRMTEKSAYEKLIRMLSHEVNNSLGAANSLLHSCFRYEDQLREEDKDDFKTALTIAISRTEHLNAFMKSFSDIVKLPLPNRRLTNAHTLLQNLATLLSEEFSRRNILVRWDCHDTPALAMMDEHQMEQVFLNILKNAMEAIKKDGTITICCRKVRGTDIVIIEDTGPGMTEAVRRQLFSPFFSTKENGQGIGLTLVQEILSQHKFEFTLESKPNEPTRFTIFLS